MSCEITIRQVENGFILMAEFDEKEYFVFQSVHELLLHVQNHFEYRRYEPILLDTDR